MAEGKDKGKGKKNVFVRACSKFIKFFKDIYLELKRVSWPNKKRVANNTLSVLVFCLVIGALIWISDIALNYLVNFIYSI